MKIKRSCSLPVFSVCVAVTLSDTCSHGNLICLLPSLMNGVRSCALNSEMSPNERFYQLPEAAAFLSFQDLPCLYHPRGKLQPWLKTPFVSGPCTVTSGVFLKLKVEISPWSNFRTDLPSSPAAVTSFSRDLVGGSARASSESRSLCHHCLLGARGE